MLCVPCTAGWMAAEAVVYNSGNGRAIRGPGKSDGFNKYFISRMNSYNSEADTALMPGVVFMEPFEFVQIENDGTNLAFKCSQNGKSWMTYATTTISDFIGAVTHVGLAMANNSGAEVVGTFEHFHCGSDEGFLS
jgi:hypothetical protein